MMQRKSVVILLILLALLPLGSGAAQKEAKPAMDELTADWNKIIAGSK